MERLPQWVVGVVNLACFKRSLGSFFKYIVVFLFFIGFIFNYPFGCTFLTLHF